MDGKIISSTTLLCLPDDPISYIDPFGLEKIVVSGGSDGEEQFKYSFIETAILQIHDWQALSPEMITWFIANWKYSPDDLANFKTVADMHGVSLTIMDNKQQLFDYMNKAGRADDPITAVSFFAHGTAFDVAGTVPNPGYSNQYAIALGYCATMKQPHNNDLNIFVSDLSKINSSDFAKGCYTFSGACRAGNSFGGVIFAQEWANLTNGSVKATTGPNGRTEYTNIFPYDRGLVNRALNLVGLKKDIGKASRETARELYGFSAQGCINYPSPTYFTWWKTFKTN